MYPTAAKQSAIGCIDDGINSQPRNITLYYFYSFSTHQLSSIEHLESSIQNNFDHEWNYSMRIDGLSLRKHYLRCEQAICTLLFFHCVPKLPDEFRII